MCDKCVVAASVALLACHPRTSINCFNPKQHSKEQHFDESDSSTRSKLDIPSPLSVSVSVSLLAQGHSLFDGVMASFVQGWDSASGLRIHNIFTVNHDISARHKFEEYREMVMLRATKTKSKKKKLAEDGNEFLGFHSAIVSCCFGVGGFCEKKSCGLCRGIQSKKASVWLNDNSRSAEQKVRREWGEKGRRAMVMCRVIAGRIGRYHKSDGYNSAIRSVDQYSYTAQELMVFNPAAVLPSFILIYDVK